MITIQLSKEDFWANKAEGYFFLLREDFKITSDLNVIESENYPRLKEILKKHKFEGKKDQSFVLTGERDGKLVQFVFLGLGKVSKSFHKNLTNLRATIHKLVALAKNLEIPEGVLKISDADSFGDTMKEVVKQICVASHFADYKFTTFKTKEDEKKEFNLKLNLIVDTHEKHKDLQESLNQGNIIGSAVNIARNWEDLPPNVLNPTYFAKEVEKIAKERKLKSRIFGRKKAVELGMGGFAAVDAGSDQDGKFIVIEYKVNSKKAPTIVLVGKGVTFDSGGISLKPSRAMTGMKFDMCGAAAVMATLQAIAQLKPDINVVGLAAVVENMPSGECTKQDDIITFMNGKTCEIQNTDAEGRLILADTLCYAEKFCKPDVILDIATLTGAVVVALSHFFTAVLTRDDELFKKLEKSGSLTGDRLWRLPLDDLFSPALKSDFADISNIGKPNYSGGTITAGMFLENFVEKTKWAHLDIAGTSNEVPGISGATGVGVKLFIDYILNYK